MANTVRHPYSNTAGNTPSSLGNGVIAVNQADGKLFYRSSAGVVTALATGGGGATEVYEYATTANFPATGSAAQLVIATDTGRIYRWAGASYIEIGPLGGAATDTRWDLFLPPAPTGVAGYSYSGTGNVSWTAPSVLAQTPVTDYTIQYSADNGTTWTTASRSPSTATSATLTGLASGSFLFRVSATNGAGAGSYSSASTLKTLDVVSGAAMAYSLRNIRTAYTGPVVQLRRSSDSSTRDCYEAELTDGTVATWASGGDAFVRTWYDQSGNARHVQQTTSSLQPQLVSSGSVLLLNGKPAIDWSAASVNRVMTGTVATSTAMTVVSVFSAVKRSATYIKLFNIGADSANSGYALTPFVWETAQDWQTNDSAFLANGYDSAQSARIVSSGAIFTSSATAQALFFNSISSAAARAFVNGTEIAYRVQTPGNTSVNASTTLYLGNNNASVQQFSGRMQEIIFWTADRLSSRAQAEYCAKGYYGIA